jgi:nucleolar protein 56
MGIHIAECVLGVFAFDDTGRLLTSNQFPRDAAEVAGRLASVQMGNPTPEHRELVQKLVKDGKKEFTLESKALVNRLAREFKEAKFEVLVPNRAGSILREKLKDIAEEAGYPQVDGLMREVNFILTRLKLKQEAAQRDRLIVQSIGLLDEIDRSINILTGHVREWYSMHFPELDRLVPDHRVYLKLVEGLGTREKFIKDSVQKTGEISEEEAKKIADAARSSVGAAFDEIDVKAVQDCVQEIMRFHDLREKVANYTDGLMAQVAPNLRAVVGGSIGAKLISLAGNLEKLSRLPASTVQVLGAEKALFRSLKGKARPPKHGVIFQYPAIRGAPKKLRGKIARALAGKIAIAARVDAMAGEYVGDALAADLRSKIAGISKKEQESGQNSHPTPKNL